MFDRRTRFRCGPSTSMLLGGCLLLVLAASPWQTLGSQTDASQPSEADAFYQAQEWQQAVTAYERFLKKHEMTATPRTFYRLGYSQHQLGNFEKAIAAFERAEALGLPPQFSRYNIAAGHARMGQTDAAFEALDKLLASGYSNAANFEQDEDFASLRQEARFAEVVDKMKENHPCNRPECRQFDFWIGHWTVRNTQGTQVGTNEISSILQSCALHEKWRSAQGGTGESINFFHPGKKKWVQVWVNPSGGIIELEGEYRDGAMHFTGKNYNADGSYEPVRASWTLLEDGRVRQFFEQSRDKGETWYTWFEGFYERQALEESE